MRAARLALAVTLLLVVASGCDWLQAGYDSGRSGTNPVEPALTVSSVGNLAPKFSISTLGRNYGQPIVIGQSLYATSFEASTNTARIEQFDATTGVRGWSTSLSTAAGSVTDPEWASGTVYAVTAPSSSSGSATLFALASSTGVTRWSVPLPSGFSVVESVTLDRGRVFVVLLQHDPFFPFGGSVAVVALDGGTGSTIWSFTYSADQQAHVGAVVSWSGRYVVLAYNCCGGTNRPTGIVGFPRTTFLDEADGSVHTESGSASDRSLRLCADDLCYGTVEDIVNGTWPSPATAVDPNTGNVVWTGIDAVAAAVSQRSAVLANPTGLTAVDPRTGSAQWTSPTLANVSHIAPPVIAGDVVYFVTSDYKATLHTYDASNGSSIGSVDIPTPATISTLHAPVVANGMVYVNQTAAISAYAP
ncbi:MAG: PQQ-binding-like beta-propeller repeat protein [Actinobacteria bacterium]|nr:PQQ-binding-like beta-propeller repeat protein [Actinomycetota bacterium]